MTVEDRLGDHGWQEGVSDDMDVHAAGAQLSRERVVGQPVSDEDHRASRQGPGIAKACLAAHTRSVDVGEGYARMHAHTLVVEMASQEVTF
jgi:hypothetical protein